MRNWQGYHDEILVTIDDTINGNMISYLNLVATRYRHVFLF